MYISRLYLIRTLKANTFANMIQASQLLPPDPLPPHPLHLLLPKARSLLVDKVEPPFTGKKYQNDMAAPGGAAAGRARYICFKDSSRKEWGPRLCLVLNETVGVDGAPY